MGKRTKPFHILVIRFSALGDVAMMALVLLAVTKKYPELKITVVSRGFHKAIFEGIEGVSFYEAKLNDRHKGFFGLWRLANEVRKLEINAVADLHQVLRSNILKLFFKINGIKVLQLDKGRNEKRALTRPNNKIFQQLKTTHQRYADVFEGLGYPVVLNGENLLPRAALTENSKALVGEKNEKWIGIAPFAAHSGKMYPWERMAEVIQKLSKTKRHKILLFGAGNTEKEKLGKIAEGNDSIINIAGRFSFSEELALISNLDLMLSMDSANGHLASNYGVPVITLWGVTHPFAGFYPYGQPMSNALLSDRGKYPLIPTSVYGNKLPSGYENVMDTISKEQILSKIQEILGENH